MILDVGEVVPSIRPRVYQTVDEAAVWKLYGGNTGTDCGRSAGIYQIDTKEKT